MGVTDDERLRTAVHVVGVILLIAAVAPFVVYGVPQVVGADHGFVVLSGSMEPAMSPGDAVIVREASPDEITERDIITFQTDSETPTTHRVVDVVERESGEAYVTKGDANEDPDSGTVPYDRVIGEVLFVIPLIGYVVNAVNTPIGFVAAVVVPLALFVGSELWTLLHSVDDDVETGGDGGPETAGGHAAATDGNSGAAGSVGSHSAADVDSEGSAITLTRSSLQLLAVVFALYLPYSAYAAYKLTEAWAITGAVATGIGFLFVGGLYASTAGDDAPPADTEDGPPDDPDGGAAAAAAGETTTVETDGGTHGG
jgi:signal peptidase